MQARAWMSPEMECSPSWLYPLPYLLKWLKWDDRNAIDILCKKVKMIGEDDRYTEKSKDILQSLLNEMHQRILTET